MGDEHVKEASWVVQSVSGASAYVHGIDYDHGEFVRELSQAVEHLKKQKK